MSDCREHQLSHVRGQPLWTASETDPFGGRCIARLGKGERKKPRVQNGNSVQKEQVHAL